MTDPEVSRNDASYFAFISYSHADKPLATRLHTALERFRVPTRFRGAIPDGGAHARPVFKDDEELGADFNLTETLQTALRQSNALIVLCTEGAAGSRWVGKEIAFFAAERLGVPIVGLVDSASEEEALSHPDSPLGELLRKIQQVGLLLRYEKPKAIGRASVLSDVVAATVGMLPRALAAARFRRSTAIASMVFAPAAAGLALLLFALGWADQHDRADAFARPGMIVGDLCEATVAIGAEAARAAGSSGATQQATDPLGAIVRSASVIVQTCIERGRIDTGDPRLAAWLLPEKPLFTREAEMAAEVGCEGDQIRGVGSLAVRLSTAAAGYPREFDFEELRAYFTACNMALEASGLSDWTRERVDFDIGSLLSEAAQDDAAMMGAALTALASFAEGKAFSPEAPGLIDEDVLLYLLSLRANQRWKAGEADAAFEDLDAMDAFSGRDAPAFKCLVRADYMHDLDAAGEFCKRAIKETSGGFWAQLASGFLALRLERYEDARKSFLAAIGPEGTEVEEPYLGLTIAEDRLGVPSTVGWYDIPDSVREALAGYSSYPQEEVTRPLHNADRIMQ